MRWVCLRYRWFIKIQLMCPWLYLVNKGKYRPAYQACANKPSDDFIGCNWLWCLWHHQTQLHLFLSFLHFQRLFLKTQFSMMCHTLPGLWYCIFLTSDLTRLIFFPKSVLIDSVPWVRVSPNSHLTTKWLAYGKVKDLIFSGQEEGKKLLLFIFLKRRLCSVFP